MNNPQLMTSKTDEHLTPDEIIGLVLDVLGKIDLDPCSNAHGRDANIPARKHFTKEDDGLVQDWSIDGEAIIVFMNHPYGRANSVWVKKFVKEYEAGHIKEGIILCAARPGTSWFKNFENQFWCAIDGRLKFKNPGNMAGATFDSAVVYFGPNRTKFAEVFSKVGTIWGQVSLARTVGPEETVVEKCSRHESGPSAATQQNPAAPSEKAVWEVRISALKNEGVVLVEAFKEGEEPLTNEVFPTTWIERNLLRRTFESKLSAAIKEIKEICEQLNSYERRIP